MTRAVALLLLVLVGVVHGHMYLRNPISRGGLNNNGGTTGPCAGLAEGSGQVTVFEVGQQVTFQFRVNQHGPAPFAFNLSSGGDVFHTGIVGNIANTVTAGPDGYNGVNVPVTIPNVICNKCAIQLSGMGQLDGSGKWFNCADIKIVAAGSNSGPQVKSVFPAGGPTSGGTAITVTGLNFGATAPASVKCRFDLATVDGTWVSATSITCTSPKRNQPSPAVLEVSVDGGSTFSSSGQTFSYTGDVILPIIDGLSPSFGLPNTTFTLKGQNFFSSGVDCKIGNKTVHGNWVSETEVSCTVPADFVLDASYDTVSVEARVDGSDYSKSGRSFSVMSSGAMTAMVAGIVVGSVVLVAVVVAAVVLLVFKKGSYGSQSVPSNWQKGRV